MGKMMRRDVNVNVSVSECECELVRVEGMGEEGRVN